jgi:hypothetical protein
MSLVAVLAALSAFAATSTMTAGATPEPTLAVTLGEDRIQPAVSQFHERGMLPRLSYDVEYTQEKRGHLLVIRVNDWHYNVRIDTQAAPGLDIDGKTISLTGPRRVEMSMRIYYGPPHTTCFSNAAPRDFITIAVGAEISVRRGVYVDCHFKLEDTGPGVIAERAMNKHR